MNKKNKKTIKAGSNVISKMIGRGSFGCVFRPNIPCKKDIKYKKKTIRNKDKVSKIMLQDSTDEIKKEYLNNKKIMKSKNYKQWAFVWDKVCYPPKYINMKKLAQIDKCMKNFKKTEEEYNKSSYMMIGDYGGQTLMEYCTKILKKGTFNSQKNFKKAFLSLFKNLDSLLIGLCELQKLKICHQDLSYGNIMYKDGKFYMVDFGLSCSFNDIKSFKKRSYSQLNGSRIYDPYPYEYMFCFGNKSELKKELNGFKRGFYKTHHDDYIRIHKGILKREDIDQEIINDLSKLNKERKEVIKKLDTYSVGILILTLICDIADSYKVSNKQIYKCFAQPELQNHLALLKDMTEYKSKSRINPKEAYKRYKSLI